MTDDSDHAQGPKLSPNTAGQHVKRCRQMMRQALHDGLIEANPFAGNKIDLSSDPSKQHFVSATDTRAILDACPDQEWTVIVALARYGGLRCPSEVLALRWSDIAWDRDRFVVTAPKTERYVGKGERVVPLFPNLRVELEALQSLLEAGCSDYVITRYRCSESNLRTTFNKIVKRAGLAVFPKPFMNLRSSARTEKENEGVKNHVLNAWFGHSAAIADKHYLQVTESDFANAVALPGDFVGQSGRRPESSGNHNHAPNHRKRPLLTGRDDRRSDPRYSGSNRFREGSHPYRRTFPAVLGYLPCVHSALYLRPPGDRLQR